MAPLMEALEERTVLSTIVWAGGNGDWDTAANWVGGVRPGANDTAQINDSNITITFSTGGIDSVGDIQFTGTGSTLKLSNGTLAVTGNTGVASNLNNYTQTGGTLDGAGTVNVSGTTTWSGGTMTGGGTTNANGGLMLGGTDGFHELLHDPAVARLHERRLRRDRAEFFGRQPNLGCLFRPESHHSSTRRPGALSSRAITSRSSRSAEAAGRSPITAR